MNKQTKKILIFAIIIVLIAAIFFISTKKTKKKQNGNIITAVEAHEITDEDIKRANDNTIPKVIIYWNMEDDKCLEVLDLFNKFYLKYSDKINFYAINQTDNATKAAVFLNNNNIEIPVSTKSTVDSSIINEDELPELPCYAFIDKDSKLLDLTNKELTEDSLEAYLDIISENY